MSQIITKRKGAPQEDDTTQPKRQKADDCPLDEKTDASSMWQYRNQVILAPMVRISTLPFRILASRYGADMVYNQELIDHKVMRLERRVNEEHGTIDFYDKKRAAFRTYEGERVVFQIGTNDGVRALKACQVIEKDVCAVDVNMGCPKHFSVHAGMGSALLRKPEKIKDILTTLKRNLSIPVTCKIRILEDPQETLDLLKIIESCGVDAVGVHARYIKDRPRDPARISLIRDLLSDVSIPTIYNGDIFYYKDIKTAKAITGADSVMLARGAQWNCSIFRPDGPLPIYDVASEYLQIAKKYDNLFANTKYTLLSMLCGFGKTDASRRLQRAKTYADVDSSIELLANNHRARSPYVAPDSKETSVFKSLSKNKIA